MKSYTKNWRFRRHHTSGGRRIGSGEGSNNAGQLRFSPLWIIWRRNSSPYSQLPDVPILRCSSLWHFLKFSSHGWCIPALLGSLYYWTVTFLYDGQTSWARLYKLHHVLFSAMTIDSWVPICTHQLSLNEDTRAFLHIFQILMRVQMPAQSWIVWIFLVEMVTQKHFCNGLHNMNRTLKYIFMHKYYKGASTYAKCHKILIYKPSALELVRYSYILKWMYSSMFFIVK